MGPLRLAARRTSGTAATGTRQAVRMRADLPSSIFSDWRVVRKERSAPGATPNRVHHGSRTRPSGPVIPAETERLPTPTFADDSESRERNQLSEAGRARGTAKRRQEA